MNKDFDSEWRKCVDFHGHSCGGLLIGFLASLYASELLGLDFSEDEEAVCIAENDTCSVDAIQVMLGCSIGKGNLLFHMAGKQAFSFYNRSTGKSVRLVLSSCVEKLRDGESMYDYLQKHRKEDMFAVKEAVIEVPERARIFDSYICDSCGEKTGERWIHIENGRKLCGDCYHKYDRFSV